MLTYLLMSASSIHSTSVDGGTTLSASKTLDYIDTLASSFITLIPSYILATIGLATHPGIICTVYNMSCTIACLCYHDTQIGYWASLMANVNRASLALNETAIQLAFTCGVSFHFVNIRDCLAQLVRL